jgi:tyrosine-protein phosphatase SIW14
MASLIVTSCTTQRGFPPEHQIVNFDKMSTTLYRGAQPTRNGLEYLASIGVKTVINLRQPGDVFPDEEATVKALGMTYVACPMSGVKAPTLEQMAEILAVIDKATGPVFIHCQYGCDRTGTVVACWRIAHGWSNEKALAEAEKYGISPLLVGLKDFVRHFGRTP